MARLSEEAREAIRADLRATVGTSNGSTRKVASRHGVSEATTRRIAAEISLELGTPESRAKTKNATAATVADMAAQRAEISQRMLAAARRALDDMDSPAKIYNFGGKDNTYNEREVPRPTTADQRNLMIIAATALDKHKMLDGYDASKAAASAVDDWLGAMLGRSSASSASSASNPAPAGQVEAGEEDA